MTGSRNRLRVGLLLCDHLDADAAAVAGDYTELYPAVFAPFDIDWQVFDITTGDFPASTADCDAWLTSGSRLSAHTDDGWIPDLLDLIRALAEEERPHVGICFGHQVIARALGGEVRNVGWGIGAKSFDVVAETSWANPIEPAFTLLMSHQDQVTRLPPDAELVATSPYCPIGAYRIGDHVAGVQGHPEFVPKLSAFLAEKRRSAIGDAVVDEAIATLDLPLDSTLVAGWAATFLRRDPDHRVR